MAKEEQEHADRSSWWVVTLITLFTLFLAIVISYSDPFQTVELKVTDQLFRLRGPITIQDSVIKLVAISQTSDEEIPENFPWPRRYYAKLIENLNKAGAKAIGIDVTLDKPDAHNPRNDSLLAEALERYSNVVLVGDIRRDTEKDAETNFLVKPHPLLQESNPNPFGLITVLKDEDDAVRRYLLSRSFGGRQYYSLALELLREYHGWNPDSIRVEDGTDFFRYGEYRIPKFGSHTMYINYFGGRNTFTDFHFSSVIDDSTVLLTSEDKEFQFNLFSDPEHGLLETEAFKDKIVIVGATMEELHDFHATPFEPGGAHPGYETHANALKTLLSGRYIYHANRWVNWGLWLFFALAIILATRRFSIFWGFLFFLFQALFITALTLFEFVEFNYLIRYTTPMTVTIIGYLGALSYDYLVEQREKRRIRGMFSSYVSPALVDRMIESGQEPQLGGDEVYITAFFSDIQSFSSFSEQLEPADLVELINEYLSAMTDIITEMDGTLDKYIGDAIVAFYGAPVTLEDHAYKACLTSQLMQRRLGKLREKWKEDDRDWPEIVHHMQNRIGINTGMMVTGNMGSSHRFNYTMMGDNVNLAARCESGAKSYGVYTMVTEQTKQEAEKYGDRCVFRYLDRIVVKGRTQPVNVYEIVGLVEHLEEDDVNCIKQFEQGTDAYLEQNFSKAIEFFERSAQLERQQPEENAYITTNPSLVYLDRCRDMISDPPPEDWNGVYVMKTK